MNKDQIVSHYELTCGDIVIRERGVFPRHHALYVGMHKDLAMVAVNHHERGVEYITLNEFLLWGVSNIKRIERYTGTNRDRKNIIPSINKLIGQKCDLVRLNRKRFEGVLEKENSGATLIGLGVLAMMGLIMASE